MNVHIQAAIAIRPNNDKDASLPNDATGVVMVLNGDAKNAMHIMNVYGPLSDERAQKLVDMLDVFIKECHYEVVS